MLNPLKTGIPYTLSISSSNLKLTYTDVVAGEVWLCSGQSNMEFQLSRSYKAKSDIQSANNSDIRLFDMKAHWLTNDYTWSASALDSVNHLKYFTQPVWEKCTSDNAANFSAVAYYFGKMLQDSLQVPIGLICNAVGGSPTESWVNRQVLEYEFPSILRNWTENDFAQDWVRTRAKSNMGKDASKLQRHPYEPGYLFEASIRPLAQYSKAGAIWYQGESNAHNKDAHAKLFKLLINSWRENWKNPELPFYYVQLSSPDRPSWTWFRDSQRRLQNEISFTGMAVSSDLGDSLDVHPKHKKKIGERLAKLALNKTYHFDNILPSGPLLKNVRFEKSKAYISFSYGKILKTSDGKPLRTLELAEYPGLFFHAKAEIVNDEIVVSSPDVKSPKYVRYGWQPFTRANLVNIADLPASTFTTEE